VKKQLNDLSLVTLDVGSVPLQDDFDDDRRNVNRVIVDKVNVGLDYPCYPQLPGSSSKPMNMALQFLKPLSNTNPNIQITEQEARLLSDDIKEPTDVIGVERAEYFLTFLRDHALDRVKGVKACVTGPFTLAAYLDSKNLMTCGASKPDIVRILAGILSRSCKRLSDLGFDLVCIDEPFLSVMLGRGKVLFKYDENFVVDALNGLITQLSCLSAVHVCGRITPLVKSILLESATDIVDHEFAETKENVNAYSKEDLDRADKFLAYGCVSSINPTVESVEEISAALERALRLYGDRLLVKPDCGFGGMIGTPDAYGTVQRKLSNMVTAAKITRQRLLGS
jgi:5-methyltetrahydropteroyltriglutamate--homocysteine methyltransferase